MSLLHARIESSVVGTAATEGFGGFIIRASKAPARPFRRALRNVLLGASAVGIALVAAVLWAVASVVLDLG
jgi:hypothetical protein